MAPRNPILSTAVGPIATGGDTGTLTGDWNSTVYSHPIIAQAPVLFTNQTATVNNTDSIQHYIRKAHATLATATCPTVGPSTASTGITGSYNGSYVKRDGRPLPHSGVGHQAMDAGLTAHISLVDRKTIEAKISEANSHNPLLGGDGYVDPKVFEKQTKHNKVKPTEATGSSVPYGTEPVVKKGVVATGIAFSSASASLLPTPSGAYDEGIQYKWNPSRSNWVKHR